MTEAKDFRVSGLVNKPTTKIPFAIKLRALKPEDAIEKIYTDLGSRHKARRFEIKIAKVEELKPGKEAEAA